MLRRALPFLTCGISLCCSGENKVAPARSSVSKSRHSSEFDDQSAMQEEVNAADEAEKKVAEQKRAALVDTLSAEVLSKPPQITAEGKWVTPPSLTNPHHPDLKGPEFHRAAFALYAHRVVVVHRGAAVTIVATPSRLA